MSVSSQLRDATRALQQALFYVESSSTDRGDVHKLVVAAKLLVELIVAQE